MKIAHIITGLDIGGAELMLKRLVLNNTNNSRFEHIVISLTNYGILGPQLKNKGIKVYSLGLSSPMKAPLAFIKLRKILIEIKPDVVQTWMYHADFIGGLAARSVGIDNIVWGVRTTDISKGASKLTKQLSKVCAKLSYVLPKSIIFAAHASKAYHISIGYDESKSYVIPNGYDIQELYPPQGARFKIRKEFNLSEDDIVIGSVGRFNTVKNQKLFVEIAARLVTEKPNLKFMLVGRDNIEQNEKLMEWIKEYELLNNFRLLGERADIPSCLEAMDIFCLHSKTEGFPNVLIEALAVGLPCVANDVGDVNYILKNYGYCIQENNINGFVETIHKVIDEVLPNTLILNEQKTNIIRYISSSYSIENIYNNYKNVWTS